MIDIAWNNNWDSCKQLNILAWQCFIDLLFHSRQHNIFRFHFDAFIFALKTQMVTCLSPADQKY